MNVSNNSGQSCWYTDDSDLPAAVGTSNRLASLLALAVLVALLLGCATTPLPPPPSYQSSLLFLNDYRFERNASNVVVGVRDMGVVKDMLKRIADLEAENSELRAK
jgi:hypothetical protein